MRTPLFFSICFLIGTHSAAQELIGFDQVPPGTLASFEVVPAQEASWYIAAPSENETTFQVDTSASRLYFANPKQGRYTVIAGIITDGKPQILVKTFFNREEVPIPIPPENSLETWIKTQIPVLVKSQNLEREVQIVADCFEQTAHRIEEGTIKTVSNALTQTQIAITGSLALASPTAVTDWTPFLTELSRQLETEFLHGINDLIEIKAVFQRIAITMKSLEWQQNVSLLKPTTEKVPNGQKQGTRSRLFHSLFTK